MGRDAVTGGTGTDLVSYAGRFTIGAPGSAGVHLTLDGQANDGDPNIDQLDSTALGEGDNIGTDVEDLTGTKREDRLIGNGLQNVLFGDEGVDTLTGGSGEDTVIAREPAVAGSGTPDVISCGSPSPLRTTTSTFGVITTLSGSDKLEADLADPKPADCELPGASDRQTAGCKRSPNHQAQPGPNSCRELAAAKRLGISRAKLPGANDRQPPWANDRQSPDKTRGLNLTGDFLSARPRTVSFNAGSIDAGPRSPAHSRQHPRRPPQRPPRPPRGPGRGPARRRLHGGRGRGAARRGRAFAPSAGTSSSRR